MYLYLCNVFTSSICLPPHHNLLQPSSACSSSTWSSSIWSSSRSLIGCPGQVAWESSVLCIASPPSSPAEQPLLILANAWIRADTCKFTKTCNLALVHHLLTSLRQKVIKKSWVRLWISLQVIAQRWNLSMRCKFLQKQRDLQYKWKYKAQFILISSLKLLTYY